MRKIICCFLAALTVFVCCGGTVYAYEADDYISREKHGYYETLQEEEKPVYDLLLEGMVNLDKEILIPQTIREYDLYNVIYKIGCDYPDIFWVTRNYTTKGTRENVDAVYFVYEYNKKEIDAINQIIDDAVDEIKESTAKMSDYEKAKYVFDWICSRTTYNKHMENIVNCEHIFLTGEAVCSGYAKAYSLILNRLGVDCRAIIGCRTISADIGHVWNEVYIDGRTIYVDSTWGDKYPLPEVNQWFDVDETEFKKSHKEIISHADWDTWINKD